MNADFRERLLNDNSHSEWAKTSRKLRISSEICHRFDWRNRDCGDPIFSVHVSTTAVLSLVFSSNSQFRALDDDHPNSALAVEQGEKSMTISMGPGIDPLGFAGHFRPKVYT